MQHANDETLLKVVMNASNGNIESPDECESETGASAREPKPERRRLPM